MSSIPLPALSIKQPESPIEQFGRAMQLKQLAGAGKLQQGELQMQQMQLEQAQMQLEDQKKIRQAFVDANGDLDSTIERARKAGVNPQTLLQLKNAQIDQATKLQTLKKDALDNMKKQNDAIGASAQAVLGVSPENRPQAYQQEMKKLLAQGIVSPEQAAAPYSEDDVRLHAAAAMTADQQITTELKKRETAAQELKAQTDAAKLKAEMPGGPLAPVDKSEMNDWLAKNPGKGPADYMKYKATLVPAFNFNLQAGGAGSSQLTPRQQSTAQAIIEGRMSPPASFALKSPYWQAVMGEVFNQDPQFSEQRAQLRKAFTVGKQSTEINAINTAMGHVGVLSDAIDALQNNNIPALNKVANAVGVQLGKDAVTTFKTIVHRVGPELSKAYIGAGGSAGERGSDEKDFDPNLSPQQLRSNVAITSQLLRSKISSLENQWDQNKAPGMKSFQEQFIMPEAQRNLNRLNPQSKGGGLNIGDTVTIKGKQMKVTAVHPDGSFDAQ